MSMGNFISGAKKTSSVSKGSILFSKEVSDQLRAQIKAEPVKDQEGVYHIKEIKTYSEENKKFIENFVKKLNADKK